MSDLNSYYDNFPDDRKEHKKKKQTVYSSKDFIPGIKGILAKLFISFTVFLISTSFIMFVLAHFLYVREMIFIVCFSAVMMLVSWGSSVVLKNKMNVIRILPIIIFVAAAYFFSPYIYYLTAIVLAYNLIVSFVVLSRLNLPERLALSQSLILVSCIVFCFYQIVFIINPNKSQSSIQAEPLFMTAGIIWIIICIFVLNFISISNASTGRRFSKSLLVGNITLTFLFAGLIVIISSINSYKDLILNAIRKVLLFLFSGSEPEVIPEESPADSGGGMDFSQLGLEEKSSAFWDFMEKVFLILAVILAAVLLFFLFKALFKLFSRLLNRARDYLKGNDSTKSILSFQDKEESIFDKNRFSDAVKNGWDRLMKNLRRKPKFSDMPDNRQRVRFLYKLLLINKDEEEKPVKQSSTAREHLLGGNATAEKEKFLSGYEKARYSDHDVSDEEVQAGLSFVGK